MLKRSFFIRLKHITKNRIFFLIKFNKTIFSRIYRLKCILQNNFKVLLVLIYTTFVQRKFVMSLSSRSNQKYLLP